MNKRIAVMVLASAACFAADPAPQVPVNPAAMQVRVVELKHLRGDRVKALSNYVASLLDPNGKSFYDANLNVMVLRGFPDQIIPLADLVRKADLPQQNRPVELQAQLRIHLVQASPDAGKDGPVAPEIASAVAQMRKSFSYTSYRQLDTLQVQIRNDFSHLTGSLPTETGRKDMLSTYDIRIDSASINEEEVGLRNVSFRLHVPYETSNGGFNYFDTNLQTSITVRKGQKVVVGKLSGEQRKDAIFVILAADIL